MKKIYCGNIHRLKIYSVDEVAKTTGFESVILVKDALFYRNRLGKLISFDYDTVLPTLYEAQINLINSFNKSNSNKDLYCVYANESEILPSEFITNKELKMLKKEYKK